MPDQTLTVRADELRHVMVRANGIRLHCVEQGQGDLVLLLHDFPSCWYSWRKQLPVLSRHFRTVALDLRGFNDSDAPERIKDYRLSELADDVIGVIEKISLGKAHLVGHGLGGAIALEAAMSRPKAVGKLVLINAVHPALLWRRLFFDLSRAHILKRALFCQLPKLPEAYFSKNACAALIKHAFTKTNGTFSGKDLEFFRQALLKPGAIAAAINYYRAAFRCPPFTVKRPADIFADTLLIWGEKNTRQSKAVIAAMEKYFRGLLRIHYLSDCRNWPHEEKPDTVNRDILNFLAQPQKACAL
ncbi:MAG: alpha/beta hydrolase [Elusimicrobia bacterium]|nr:alpha/beta hydrolase [Elusimicrobiota bacterium]